MMQRQLLFLALLAAAPDLYALTPPQPENNADRQAEPQTQEVEVERVRPGAAAPAATFSPTEKIEADSAVSFPVDI